MGRHRSRQRTIIVRRLKGSHDSTHYLERDELAGLKRLERASAYVFVNERGEPFGRMGIARMIERAGEAAKLPFPVHVHMLRHSTGYALAGKGMDTRRLQHFLGHASITNTVRYTAMSPEPFKDLTCRMVEAARDARLSIPLTQDSNRVSTNTNLCPWETRFCAAETKAPKGSLKSNRQFAETKCAHESPPVRACSQ
jgi:hypothetical protein